MPFENDWRLARLGEKAGIAFSFCLNSDRDDDMICEKSENLDKGLIIEVSRANTVSSFWVATR